MIYLDHAAATPVSGKALKAMEPYFTEEFFNPSAGYLPARKVAAEYEAAKSLIARSIGAKGADLVMTAGATEANNLAFTVLESFISGTEDLEGSGGLNAGASEGSGAKVLYLATEHDSVRKVAEKYGGEEILVDKFGRISIEDFRAKLSDSVVLVSVSLANNELGTIQPLSEIAGLIREVRLGRLSRGVRRPLYLHSDASQAMNLIDINVARLGVDLLTLNSAKVYGPKGVGALYVSHEVRLSPVTVGGGQERGLRSGTENVPGVIGFSVAMTEAKAKVGANRKKYAEFRRLFLAGLSGYELVNRRGSLDNFVVLCYNGIDAERLIFLLEAQGVLVSTGAACAASKGEKSHVFRAIGLSESEINGSLRVTFGETNTREQILEATRIINEVVAGERERISNGQ